jgi:hypothetical protein
MTIRNLHVPDVFSLFAVLLTSILITACAAPRQNTEASGSRSTPVTTSISMPVSSEEVIHVTEIPIPANTPILPFGTPTSIPIITSGGLGATRDAWEEKQGTAISVPSTYQGAYSAVYGGGLQVTSDFRGVLVSIGKDYKSKGMVSLDAAKLESLKLIPRDAVLTYHFDHPSTNPHGAGGVEPLVLVDIYNSTSLSTLFTLDEWFDKEPDTFYIQYEQYPSKGNQIGAFLMELSWPP